MKSFNKKILTLSLFAAFALQSNLVAKDTKSLGTVDVVSSNDTETSKSYTIDSMRTSSKLNLSIKDTPQSVSVMTTQQMKD
ncbi:hypothetical protein [Malaciobacter halophilus]|uniref:hypothetical protein n=1 Tax=Malaciobacter halophilus TaxID=197482 RepID=UPI001D177B9D|nr:hypothetical protein [Malaciobacter halophilus]